MANTKIPTPLQELCEYASQSGSDIMQVQASGGNVSLKLDGTLVIKASGTKLALARQQDIFVRLPLAEAERLARGGQDDFSSLISTGALKPSIETAMHVLLPWRVVVHVHCLNTIARTVMCQGPKCFRQMLGNSVAYIPYARPGAPLARAIASALTADPPSILILENHGLVVGADSVEETFALLGRTRKALELAPRASVPPNLAFLNNVKDAGWSLPHAPLIHSLATDATSFRCACAGPLYPDHVVFLGGDIPVARRGESVSQARARYEQCTDRTPDYLLFEGQGVLVRPDLRPFQQEMLEAFALVCQRCEAASTPHGLGAEQVAELLGWDAEKYRQQMAGRQA